MSSGPRTLNGKVVLQVYMLDNSMKTLLVEPTSTVHVRRSTAVPRHFRRSCSKAAAIRGFTSCYRGILLLVQDVCRQMADKIGFSDPEDDSLCFSLNECLDGVTSESWAGIRHSSLPWSVAALLLMCLAVRSSPV